VSFSNAYSTTMATGGNRWDALQSGGMAFGSSLFLNAPTTMSGAMMHQARVNVLTQTHSIWRDPNLTYTDFSMSSLGYNTLTGGTLSYGLSALNISGRVGGITGVMAEAPFDFGMGASFSGLGMAFESGGKYSYTIGNMLPIDPAPSFNYSLSNDYGFDAAWNDYMYGGF